MMESRMEYFSAMYSAIPADGVYAAWFTVLGHGPVVGSVTPGER